jgi:DNA-directed RNA polymerase subunit RPC12/RpoP
VGENWMAPSGYAIRDTLVLLTASVAVLLIVLFIASNQAVYAILIFNGLTIPLALISLEYRKNYREFQCKNCNHWFSVSYLKLLFTAKVHGTDPAPTTTVTYDLKCPNCNKKDWLTPSG